LGGHTCQVLGATGNAAFLFCLPGMSMKKRINTSTIALARAFAIAIAFATPQAFAQSNVFKGVSAGIGLNIAESSSELTSGGTTRQNTDTDNNFKLQIQYNLALSDRFLLGMGTNIGFGDLKAGNFARGQAKIKDSYSLYIAPSYAINSTFLAYGKLAYLNAKALNALGKSINFDNGFGYGVGLQIMYTKNWFGQAELMINQYSDSASANETAKLKNGVYSLTAGYKF
jgi:opacity protein-like surface antigen